MPGPLLFLIYINDLEKGIKSKVKFFADDTMIYSVVHNPTLTASVLNHALEIISQSGLANGKCHSILNPTNKQ